MANMAGKLSEVKYVGRPGGRHAGHREVRNVAGQVARRSYRRALRAEGRAISREALFGEGPETFAPLMGEDADAHVSAFEAWDRETFYACDCDGCQGDPWRNEWDYDAAAE